MPSLDAIQASDLIRFRDLDARIALVTVHAEPTLAERGLVGCIDQDEAVAFPERSPT
jgi:hypothetical protein